jgi:hypothetical protein
MYNSNLLKEIYTRANDQSEAMKYSPKVINIDIRYECEQVWLLKMNTTKERFTQAIKNDKISAYTEDSLEISNDNVILSFRSN